ncbi:hypothetical protein HDV05_006746 [Chytridiales sp. JEL 0842]|nr:hypothetical protein HDV05_006746 [Chytridiales sp. JEL 0842]
MTLMGLVQSILDNKDIIEFTATNHAADSNSNSNNGGNGEATSLTYVEYDLLPRRQILERQWHLATILSDEALLFRFLNKHKLHIPKTLAALETHLTWRFQNSLLSTSLPTLSPKAVQFASAPLLRYHGQDKRGRPCVVVNIGKLEVGGKQGGVEELREFLMFALEVGRRCIADVNAMSEMSGNSGSPQGSLSGLSPALHHHGAAAAYGSGPSLSQSSSMRASPTTMNPPTTDLRRPGSQRFRSPLPSPSNLHISTNPFFNSNHSAGLHTSRSAVHFGGMQGGNGIRKPVWKILPPLEDSGENNSTSGEEESEGGVVMDTKKRFMVGGKGLGRKKKGKKRVNVVTQLCAIVDLKGVGLSNLNLEVVPVLYDLFHRQFPQIFGTVYVLNFNWMHSGVWTLLKRMLTPEAAQKYLFLSPKELLSYFDSDSLLPEHGGTSKEPPWTTAEACPYFAHYGFNPPPSPNAPQRITDLFIRIQNAEVSMHPERFAHTSTSLPTSATSTTALSNLLHPTASSLSNSHAQLAGMYATPLGSMTSLHQFGAMSPGVETWYDAQEYMAPVKSAADLQMFLRSGGSGVGLSSTMAGGVGTPGVGGVGAAVGAGGGLTPKVAMLGSPASSSLLVRRAAAAAAAANTEAGKAIAKNGEGGKGGWKRIMKWTLRFWARLSRIGTALSHGRNNNNTNNQVGGKKRGATTSLSTPPPMKVGGLVGLFVNSIKIPWVLIIGIIGILRKLVSGELYHLELPEPTIASSSNPNLATTPKRLPPTVASSKRKQKGGLKMKRSLSTLSRSPLPHAPPTQSQAQTQQKVGGGSRSSSGSSDEGSDSDEAENSGRPPRGVEADVEDEGLGRQRGKGRVYEAAGFEADDEEEEEQKVRIDKLAESVPVVGARVWAGVALGLLVLESGGLADGVVKNVGNVVGLVAAMIRRWDVALEGQVEAVAEGFGSILDSLLSRLGSI